MFFFFFFFGLKTVTKFSLFPTILQVSDDGIIVFDEDIKGQTNKPKKFPYEYSVIAPLWQDFDGVELYYREITPDNSPEDLEVCITVIRYQRTVCACP